jgi:hypothetical protein
MVIVEPNFYNADHYLIKSMDLIIIMELFVFKNTVTGL